MKNNINMLFEVLSINRIQQTCQCKSRELKSCFKECKRRCVFKVSKS